MIASGVEVLRSDNQTLAARITVQDGAQAAKIEVDTGDFFTSAELREIATALLRVATTLEA